VFQIPKSELKNVPKTELPMPGKGNGFSPNFTPSDENQLKLHRIFDRQTGQQADRPTVVIVGTILACEKLTGGNFFKKKKATVLTCGR